MDTDIKDIEFKPSFFADDDDRKFILIKLEVIQFPYKHNVKKYLENCALPFKNDCLKIVSRNETNIIVKCYIE